MSISYEEWVELIFNHQVAEKDVDFMNWYNIDKYVDLEDEFSEIEKTHYLTRLFENATTDLVKYSDKQINEGLYYLIGEFSSNYSIAWKSDEVEWADKKRFIMSIYSLFANFFANKCSNSLVNEAKNPINGVCFMWWDTMPMYLPENYPLRIQIEQMFLGIMKKTLQLKSVACQQAALHGLGHYYDDENPKATQVIIDEYIKSFRGKHDDITKKLLEYAMYVRTGNVQ